MTTSQERITITCFQTEPFTLDSNAVHDKLQGIPLHFMRHSVPSNETAWRFRDVLAESVERYPDRIRFHKDGAYLVSRYLGRRERVYSRFEVSKHANSPTPFMPSPSSSRIREMPFPAGIANSFITRYGFTLTGG